MQHHSLCDFQGGGQGVKLTATFHPQAVSVSVNPSAMGISIGTPVARDYVERDPYTGDYQVIPKADEDQILPTKDKRMTDDVTVLRVPYYETSNVYGNTVYIASEVE